MKSRWERMSMVCAASLPLLGCAPKEYALTPNRMKWLDADRADAANAKEMKEPSIMPKTHFAAGQLFEQQGQIQKAIVQYRKAIAVAADYVPAYNRIGVLLGRLGRHAEAEDALRQAVGMRPDWAFLRNNLGFEYMLQERWQDAEAELRNALRLQPDFARAHNNLGVVLAKLGRFDEALVEFKEAMPESDAVYNLGLMYRGENRYPEAASAFERALSLDPKFEAAKYQLAQVAPGSPRLAAGEPSTPAMTFNPASPAVAAVPTNPVIRPEAAAPIINAKVTQGPPGVLWIEPTPVEPVAVVELEAPATPAIHEAAPDAEHSDAMVDPSAALTDFDISAVDPSVLIVEAQPCDETDESMAQDNIAEESPADHPTLDVGLATDEIPLGLGELSELDDPCAMAVAAEYESEVMESFAELADEEGTSIEIEQTPASSEHRTLLARIGDAWEVIWSLIPNLAGETAEVLPVAAETEVPVEEEEVVLSIPMEEGLALLANFSTDGVALFQPTDAWRELVGLLDASAAFAALPRTDLFELDFTASQDLAMLGD